MAKKTDMYGVIFDEGGKGETPSIDSDASDFYLPFDKEEDFFAIYENEILFYRGVEKLVRTDDFYKKYINYLINVVGMNTCQVLSNIEADEHSKVTLEMHHGPILTLFDITMIICNWCRYHNIPITTFDVADMILEEHQQNRVRVVLVTKTVHQQIHDGNIILNYNQGFGDTASFLEKYHDGISKDIQDRIDKYIEWSKEHDSFDNEVLEVATVLKRYGNNDLDVDTIF